MKSARLAVFLTAICFVLSCAAVYAEERVFVKLEDAPQACRLTLVGSRVLYTLVYVTGKKPILKPDGTPGMDWWVVPKNVGERSRGKDGRWISDNVPEESVLFLSQKYGRVTLGIKGVQRAAKCPPWTGDSGTSAEYRNSIASSQ